MINIAHFISLYGKNSIVNAGSFSVGKRYQIREVGTTDFVALGASANTIGAIFAANATGSGNGNAVLVDSINNFQNFFYSQSSSITLPFLADSPSYIYAPFKAEGASAQLGGENDTLTLLFPFSTFAVRLVENGAGNRLSSLLLRTVWYESNSTGENYEDYQVVAQYSEGYVGIGASFSETTIELRFRSAMDSVNANFPAQSLTRKNAGILPLSADLALT